MEPNRILVKFLVANEGKKVKIFINNGFQLQGQVVDYDETHLEVVTDSYGRTKHVPVTIASISTIVPW